MTINKETNRDETLMELSKKDEILVKKRKHTALLAEYTQGKLEEYAERKKRYNEKMLLKKQKFEAEKKSF